MEKYDYRRAIIDDVKDWIMNDSDIPEEGFYDEISDWIYDEVFENDGITGNGWSYYGTEEKCSEYLSNNFDLIYEAIHECNPDEEVNSLILHYENQDLARYFDCMIRTYLLSECINQAINELEQEKKIKRVNIKSNI